MLRKIPPKSRATAITIRFQASGWSALPPHMAMTIIVAMKTLKADRHVTPTIHSLGGFLRLVAVIYVSLRAIFPIRFIPNCIA